MDEEIRRLVELLTLSPHPEGGFFRELYRSDESVPAEALPSRYGGPRRFSSSIYYLLTPDSFSAMHRLASDEVFHFYAGDPVSIVRLFPDGDGDRMILGPSFMEGQHVQCTVPRGYWQGLSLVPGGRFALLGTTVSPAFEFDDFELGERGALMARYAAFADDITRLTRVTDI